TGTVTGNDFPSGKRTEYRYLSDATDARLEHNLVEIIDPREVAAGTRRPRLRVHYDDDVESPSFDRVIAQDLGGTNATGVSAGGRIEIRYVDHPRPRNDGSVEALRTLLLAEAVLTEWSDAEGALHEVRSSGAGLPIARRTYSREGDGPRALDTLRPPPETQPPFWEDRFSWSVDGLLLSHRRSDGTTAIYERDLDAPLREMRARCLREIEVPAPSAEGEPAATIVVERRFDPIFGREIERRGPAFSNEGIEVSWRATLDYQEGSSIGALADELGTVENEIVAALAHAGIEIGLGDLNGDGSTSGARGDIVEEILPPVAGQEGEARRVLRHDPFGQPIDL